jgi:hypothetical protein
MNGYYRKLLLLPLYLILSATVLFITNKLAEIRIINAGAESNLTSKEDHLKYFCSPGRDNQF